MELQPAQVDEPIKHFDSTGCQPVKDGTFQGGGTLKYECKKIPWWTVFVPLTRLESVQYRNAPPLNRP